MKLLKIEEFLDRVRNNQTIYLIESYNGVFQGGKMSNKLRRNILYMLDLGLNWKFCLPLDSIHKGIMTTVATNKDDFKKLMSIRKRFHRI